MAKVYKRNDGRWCTAYTHGVDANGKPKRKYLYGKTKKEVEEKLRLFANDIADFGKALDTNNIILSDWAYKHLFINMLHTVSASTFDRYKGIYDNHIKDSSIGFMNVKDITQIHIQQYFNSKTNLAKASLKKLQYLLCNIFNGAISNNIIRVNPMDNIKLPKSTTDEKEIEILTIDEQTAYIAAAQQEKRGLLYLLTLFTGLRLGEVIGLRWSNIDLNESMLYIRESLKRSKVYNADGSYTIQDVVKDPKTSNSKRSIPLPQFILVELKKYKIKSFNQENDLVFPSEAGTPLRSENVRRTHYRICDRAGIRRISFHALRHTFATRMIEKNTDIKTVQKWLGHSKIELTYNIYVHVQENTIKESVKVLDDLYEEMMSV